MNACTATGTKPPTLVLRYVRADTMPTPARETHTARGVKFRSTPTLPGGSRPIHVQDNPSPSDQTAEWTAVRPPSACRPDGVQTACKVPTLATPAMCWKGSAWRNQDSRSQSACVAHRCYPPWPRSPCRPPPSAAVPPRPDGCRPCQWPWLAPEAMAGWRATVRTRDVHFPSTRSRGTCCRRAWHSPTIAPLTSRL